MDTVLPEKFPFILDRNLVKANCIEKQVCTSCDTVVLVISTYKMSILTQVNKSWRIPTKNMQVTAPFTV